MSLGWLLPSEKDLRGSDLENMSLSKRFLKEGREEKLAGMEGDRVSGPKVGAEPGDGLWLSLRWNRKGRHFLAHLINFIKCQGPQGFSTFVTLALKSRKGRLETKETGVQGHLGLYCGLEQPGLHATLFWGAGGALERWLSG